MPIRVPDNLPAKEVLKGENIFIMKESRAYSQDIRPLKIVILNLMPNKQETEVQLLRVLSNTPLQIDIVLMHMKTHVSKNTSSEYLKTFYVGFEDIRDQRFDGMIITGAPIEHLPFEEVNYWDELCQVLAWTRTNVTSTFHLCWAAQAGLYYHYGVKKFGLPEKMFGIFLHKIKTGKIKLFFGFDDEYYAPQSRHTDVCREDILSRNEIEILSESDESGINIVASKDGRQIFVMGHGEYSQDTLKIEYFRDLEKGDKITLPKNYFPQDDPSRPPLVKWRAHGNLLYNNWLNYYVYQETPYEL